MRLEPRALTRAAVAATVAGFVGWLSVSLLGGTAGVVIGALAAAVVFAVLAAALRIVPRDDAAWLEQAIGRALHGQVGRFCRLCARPAAAQS